MTRGELFPVVAGGIGFVADIITIIEAARPRVEHAGQVSTLHWPLLMGVTTVYGWFIFAWFLTKWRFLRDKEYARNHGKGKPALDAIAFKAVFSIGIVILPLILYSGYSIAATYEISTDIFGTVLSTTLIGALIGGAVIGVLYCGMPLIYDDIR